MALSLSCADLGKYVWFNQYEPPTAPGGFVIAPGDTLFVRFYLQDTLNTHAKVRADGQITLPLLNDVQAAGYTPAALGQQLETRFKDFLKQPVVSVAVEEAQALQIPVAGEVVKQGVVAADRGTGLLKVLMLSGGLTDFAHKDRIFVVRTAPQPARIRFSWEALSRGETAAARFEMRPGDTVVVE